MTGAGSFLGHTQMRPTTPTVSNGVVRLQLDTYNPSAITPGDSFFGTDIFTKQSFDRGEGLIFEARGRIVGPTPRGIVAAFFTFVTNGNIRDEIDFELLSNDINDDNERVLTNVFNNDDFSKTGDKAFANAFGLDLTHFNTFKIQWLQNKVQWFINDMIAREESSIVPDKATQYHLNFWVPDSFFGEAYDSGLQPASTANQNQIFFFEVDYVTIATIGGQKQIFIENFE